MNHAKIELVRDERARRLADRVTELSDERYLAAAERRRESRDGIEAVLASVAPAVPRGAADGLGELALVPFGLDRAGLAAPAYTEGVVFQPAPYGDLWVEGEMLQHEQWPDSGRLYLRCGAGATPCAPYGTHGGGMGWSLVFTTDRPVRVEVRPWLQYAYAYVLGNVGLGSARISGGLKITATGFQGWGGGGAGGGGTFHVENTRRLFAETADAPPHNAEGEDKVTDMHLAFDVQPGRPTVVRIGSWMECAAERSPVIVSLGDGVASGWLDATLRFAWVETALDAAAGQSCWGPGQAAGSSR
jgi:hypothetical protein